MKKIAIEEHWDVDLIKTLPERLEDMDKAGIDMQVISATIMPHSSIGIKEANDWAKKNNNGFAKIVEKYPGRFSSFAAISLLDPQEATKELERAVTQLGFKGTLIGAEKRTFLDDPKYWGILDMAEKLDVPIYLHPQPPPVDMISPYLKYPISSRSMWGFSAEAGLHALRLILGGVFEKFPKLKVILGHLGESVPFQLWRLDNRWIKEKDGIGNMFPVDPSASLMKRTPSEYFKSNFYITTSGMFWEPALQLCISGIGVDRIMFAVDYSAESNLEAVKFMESANLSSEDKEKIYHINAEKVLRL